MAVFQISSIENYILNLKNVTNARFKQIYNNLSKYFILSSISCIPFYLQMKSKKIVGFWSIVCLTPKGIRTLTYVCTVYLYLSNTFQNKVIKTKFRMKKNHCQFYFLLWTRLDNEFCFNLFIPQYIYYTVIHSCGLNLRQQANKIVFFLLFQCDTDLR